MQWQDVIENPYLKNLPFKIELNRWGRIEMSPASNRHALLQSRPAQWVCPAMGQGETLTEASVQTSDGVRVPDVVWASDEFPTEQDFKTPFRKRPLFVLKSFHLPIHAWKCSTNPSYLEAGAAEVWLVSEAGQSQVEDREGPSDDSPCCRVPIKILQR